MAKYYIITRIIYHDAPSAPLPKNTYLDPWVQVLKQEASAETKLITIKLHNSLKTNDKPKNAL